MEKPDNVLFLKNVTKSETRHAKADVAKGRVLEKHTPHHAKIPSHQAQSVNCWRRSQNRVGRKRIRAAPHCSKKGVSFSASSIDLMAGGITLQLSTMVRL